MSYMGLTEKEIQIVEEKTKVIGRDSMSGGRICYPQTYKVTGSVKGYCSRRYHWISLS